MTAPSRGRLGLAALLLVASVGAFAWLATRGGFGWQPNVRIPPPSPFSAGAAKAEAGPDDFYARRFGIWGARRARRQQARTSLQASELRWVTTAQDARVALMVSEATGFDTWGVETQVAEIPAGWHTGRHSHGEEAIFIVSGDGFAVVDSTRYDFHAGTTLGLPYGSAHQLFNTGSLTARYVSASSGPLEEHLGLYRLEQLESCGPTQAVPELPVSRDGYDRRGRRIRLLWEQASYREGAVGLRARAEAWLRAGLDLRSRSGDGTRAESGRAAELASRLGHHSGWIRTMGEPGAQGFPNRLVLMSGLLIDAPGSKSGRHSHLDAILYVVAGRGYSEVDGRNLPWEAGTSLHLQGPQTSHQHFNTGVEPAMMLRIASGLRPSLDAVVADSYPMLWYEAQGPIGAEAAH